MMMMMITFFSICISVCSSVWLHESDSFHYRPSFHPLYEYIMTICVSMQSSRAVLTLQILAVQILFPQAPDHKKSLI